MASRRVPWTCPRCARSGPRVSDAALCTDCTARLAAEGRVYCTRCRQVVPAATWRASNRVCIPCHRAIDRRTKVRLRGLPPDPPPGYVRLSVAARRMGYDQRELTRRIHLGWMAGRVWQRTPRGAWYIEDCPAYPAWQDGRRRAA